MGCVCITAEQLETNQNELEQLKNDLQQTQTQLNSVTCEYKEIQNDLQQKQNDLQQAQNDLCQTQQQRQKLEGEYKETKEELDKVKVECKQLTQNNTNLNKINVSLNTKVQSLQQEKDKYEYSWYYIEHGKCIELETSLMQQLEYLKVTQSFTHKHKMSYSKFTKVSIDVATEKKSFGLTGSVSIVRRKVNSDEQEVHGYYPVWWKKVKNAGYGDVHLVEMNIGTNCIAMEVAMRFYETSDRQIIKIETVQNKMLYDKWCHERQILIKLIGEKNINERNLFHGTKNENMQYIETEGFRKEFNKTAVHGKGTYFARDACYSVAYSRNVNGIGKIFECKVLCGESVKGNVNYQLTTWPKKSCGLIYDSLIDNIQHPSMFVIHENNRVYPMFVITFK